MAWCVLLALAACGNGTDKGGVVAWWHRAEGGAIAAQRPPPPDVDAAYPNLSVVPPRPRPIDPAVRSQTYAALAADRNDAVYEAAIDPLAAAPPRAENGLFAPSRPVPAAADAAGAALDAAGPAGPPRPAPRPAPASPVLLSEPAPDAPPPPIPDQPPPPPRLAGVVIPATMAHLPPRAPLPTTPAARLSAADTAPLAIAFAPGSALVPPDQRPGLQALAFRRGRSRLEITGFGEAEEQDVQSRVAGLQLGLLRARAVAAVLVGDGSPASGMRLAAQADGRGAAARLLQ